MPNTKVERNQLKLKVSDYPKYFFDHVRNNCKAVFHNADMYPPHYNRARAITWIETEKALTTSHRLMPSKKSYPLERYFIWSVSSTPHGKWRREYFIDPIIYLYERVVWRNLEASSYDVAELKPKVHDKNTYVLQEYFIPVLLFNEFVPRISEILQRYKVNVLNISIRHAKKNSDSILSWAKEEVFAFVLYYKQQMTDLAKNKVAIWTRELIEAAISVGGTYYLPYQPHATPEQFYKAYPRAKEFFALKKLFDPQNTFRNKLWDNYYSTDSQGTYMTTSPTISNFKTIFLNTPWRDKFYLFLQHIYNIYPENEFHCLIQRACQQYNTDKDIYNYIQEKLPTIKPILSELRYAIPALVKQKKEIAQQTIALLGTKRVINGYMEIGSTGRYISKLQKNFKIKAPIYIVNDIEPGHSLVDIAERGQIQKNRQFYPFK